MDEGRLDERTLTDGADDPLRFDRIRTSPIAGVRPRLGVSVPGAIGGVLLIGALAFGANLGATRSLSDTGTSSGSPDTAIVEDVPKDAADEPTDRPGDEPTKPDPTQVTKPVDESSDEEPASGPDAAATEKPEPTAKPTLKPEPKTTPRPTKKPEPEPTAKPVLSLSLSVKEGAVLIDWGACEDDGAQVYKVVRSTDSTVKWPTDENDDLIAAVTVGGSTKTWDQHAAPGKKAWYRVFCLRHTEDGYKVQAATAAKAIEAPDEPEPTPKPTPEHEPSALWIEAGADGGNVALSWEACGGEGFSHYRVLRKTGDDAQVVGEIENASTTTYVDDGLEAGTYHYAVQCKGHVGDDWTLLGSTAWTTVTVE